MASITNSFMLSDLTVFGEAGWSAIVTVNDDQNTPVEITEKMRQLVPLYHQMVEAMLQAHQEAGYYDADMNGRLVSMDWEGLKFAGEGSDDAKHTAVKTQEAWEGFVSALLYSQMITGTRVDFIKEPSWTPQQRYDISLRLIDKLGEEIEGRTATYDSDEQQFLLILRSHLTTQNRVYQAREAKGRLIDEQLWVTLYHKEVAERQSRRAFQREE